MAGTILYKLSLDATKFEKGLKTAERQLQRTAENFKKVGANLSKYITAPIAALGAVTVKAYDVQAKAEQSLLVALKGRGDVQQRLIAQAKQLQKTTLYGDEETIKAQALIAAFVKEEDQIKKVLPLVQDLATAKGMDLAGAADLVSKTLGSSTNALSRYGIQVEGAVGSNKRLTSLVNGLTSAFGGQAEAAALVGAGGLTQLKNAVGDLGESFGKIIVEYINPFVTKLRNFVERLSEMDESTKRNVLRWAGFAAALGPAIFVVGKIIAVVAGLIKIFRVLNATLLANPIILIIAAIVAAIAGLIFVFKSVKDSIYAFYGYFHATWLRIELIFTKGSNFVTLTLEKMINGVINLINGLANKLGFNDIIKGSFDISATADRNKAKVKELEDQINAVPFNSLSDVWAEFSNAAGDNFKKVSNIFSFNMDKVQEKAIETGAVITSAFNGRQIQNFKPLETLGKNKNTSKEDLRKLAGDVFGNLNNKQKKKTQINEDVDKTFFSKENQSALAEWNNEAEKQAQKIQKTFGDTKKVVVEASQVLQQAAADMFASFGESLGNLVSGTDQMGGLFNRILKLVFDFGKSFGKALVAAGVSALAFKKLLVNPVAAIAAGTALIALSTIASNILQKGVKPVEMAEGGIIPGGFPNDSYPAMLQSGETVLPKPKPLGAGMMGGLPNEIVLRASYDELIGVLNFGNKRVNS